MSPISRLIVVLVSLIVGLVAGAETLGSPSRPAMRLIVLSYFVVAAAVLWQIRCPSCRTPVMFGWRWWQPKPTATCEKCGYDLGKRPTT
jgi:hypothetical protein